MNYKAIFLKALPHLLALIVMTGASVAYFYPQLEGKVIQMDDGISGAQGYGELKEYSEKTGDYYLWSNGQFGGMPKMMWVKMKYNKILSFYKVFTLGFEHPIGMYLAMMIFSYFLLTYLKNTPILNTAFSIGTALCASNVILYSAGHYSKIATLVFTPLIILGALLLYRSKKRKIGFLVLSFALGGSLTQQHPQMTYYIAMFFIVFILVYFVDYYKKQNLKEFFQISIVGLLACVLALSISSTRILSIYDYSKSSIRGGSALGASASDQDRASDDGLDWEYATQWSNDLKDLTACFIVPGFVGGSGGEKVSKKSESFKKFRIERAPLYWGNLPFTAGPMYLGVSIFYLFVLGLFVVKGNLKWWMGFGILVMTIFSMGKNFESINRILFDYLPMYDKFRAPQSILNTLLFYFPILGLLGLGYFLSPKKVDKKKKKSNQKKSNINILSKKNKSLFLGSSIVLVPLILIYFIGPVVLSFDGLSDPRYVQQGLDINIFKSDRINLLKVDSLRSLFIVFLIGLSIWLYNNKSLNRNLTMVLIAVVIIFDIWGVSKRYVDHDDFVRPKKVDELIGQMRPIDQQLKQIENDRSRYRIQDLSINTYNSSSSSYYHNTLGGYDPAKLSRYQDIIERHLAKSNMSVYNMLNTKYFIVNGENGPTLSQNGQANGNAWFVNNIVEVSSPLAEINALDIIDTKTQAVILKDEFVGSYDPLSPDLDTLATIELVDYVPDRLTYRSSSSTPQLAVFSEIWYNGNRDWVSYIDGKKVDHLRVNYLLRGLMIPSGNHEITFEFMPVVYSVGEKLSLAGMIVFVLILFWVVFEEYNRKIKLS